ncbi:MAG: trypsin-like peptidase domain-containing protein [Phycisphaerales bacterium]|nr:trypsin-like peptidase domain-containing protein [Phycisphaerales bacterium]
MLWRRPAVARSVAWMLAGAAVASAQEFDPALTERALETVRADEQHRVDVFDQAAAAVVLIFSEGGVYAGGGSGVVIDPRGYGLTNFHVVAEFIDSRRGVGGMADGKLYPLRVLGVDPGGDLVMFKLEGREAFPYAELGDSRNVRVGDWAAPMGNPFALSEDYKPTITFGIVSGLNRYQEGQKNFLEYADCIQVASSINPGNSGGPLFDMSGRVIGINGRASFQERGRVNVGLGYAISARQIERFLPSLRAGYLCEHGNLGMQVGEIAGAVVVRRVQPLTAAEKAGLEVGDVLAAIDDRHIHTANEYNNALAVLPADWPIEIAFRRGEEELRAAVRVDRLPLEMEQPYLLDVGHNLAEMRRQFAVWRTTADLGPISGARVFSGDADVARFDFRDGRITIAEAPSDADARTELLDVDTAILEELAAIITPLIAETHDDFGWSMARGTAFEGRIVRVNEHRAADGVTIVHWLFADRDESFVAARVSDGTSTRATWRRETTGPRPDVDVWTRESAAGAAARVELRWERESGSDEPKEQP